MRVKATDGTDGAGAAQRARWRPFAWLGRSLAVVTLAVSLGVVAIASYCGVLIYDGNLQVVDSGVLYRSAQPDGAELASYARAYGIKSVLNLRGAHVGEAWYDDEAGASRALGLVHYDYPISAKRVVTRQQIAEILEIVRTAPKPLLIHCKSGSDRSGLVAALYRYATGAGAAAADGELSLAYGHFPYLTSRTGAMDASYWAYVRATSGARRP